MSLAQTAIKNRTVTLVMTLVAIGAGLQAFDQLSWLEDPEFTIKEAIVITPYPGASAAQVELEVTDKVEQAAQKLSQVKRIKRSRSSVGLSTVNVEIQDQYDRPKLPQVWDELRRKVGDMQGELPPGAGPSIVFDDFGDVWGVFVVVYGDEYSYAELREYAKLLRREFTLVKDVAKVELFGELRETIYVEPMRDKLAQLGISPDQIVQKLHDKNIVSDAGRVEFGPELVTIQPTGNLNTVEDFGAILISSDDSERQIYLRDVATVRRAYQDPATAILRYDGVRGVGIGISTVSGGNVVKMGELIEARWNEMLAETPAGINVGIVSLQSDAVNKAISGFVVSLVEAVVIVILVLMIFMGLRSAILIGFVLFLTICGTLVFMEPWGVALERISLGALIIALGMLVDNAIVVVDGMLMKLRAGVEAKQAADEVVSQQSMPLLGATAVAIMAFAAIGVSEDSTGEYCRSLFQVVFLSLGLSWVTAVTVTPLLCVMFLKAPESKPGEEDADPYGGAFYTAFKSVLSVVIRARYVSIAVVIALFAVSLVAFQDVDQSFFPNSTRPQFMVEFWMPEGTRIQDTEAQAAIAEDYLSQLPHATHVSTFVGQGGMRFLLTYTPEQPNSAYAQFLVDVDDYEAIDDLIAQLERELPERVPNALVYGKKFLLGPGEGGKMQVRVTGDDRESLRSLATQVSHIMHDDGGAKGIRIDWREPVKSVVPVFSPQQASLTGIDIPDIAATMRRTFEGLQTGVYREKDELLPIVFRAPSDERDEISNIQNIQIWSPAAHSFIPIRQVVSSFETEYVDSMKYRRNRKPTITIHCDQKEGSASVVLNRLMPKIAELELPPGFVIEYGGEYESSNNGRAGLAASIPMFLLAMVLIVIVLFNALRQPLIIWLTVPLALIGVTWGLLATKQPFGFMALLGFLSLTGMLIKNAIVLIDQIDLEIREGKDPWNAILDSAASRLRPVSMAALTTILGMIPLLADAFFIAMAVTVMAGLAFATLLTMLLVPVLYATLFNIKAPTS